VIGSSLLWEMMLWSNVSVSCIYFKRRKFRPKMRQYAFGGRAPRGHARELERSPDTLAAIGGCLLLRREGKGKREGRGWEGEGGRGGMDGRGTTNCIPHYF